MRAAAVDRSGSRSRGRSGRTGTGGPFGKSIDAGGPSGSGLPDRPAAESWSSGAAGCSGTACSSPAPGSRCGEVTIRGYPRTALNCEFTSTAGYRAQVAHVPGVNGALGARGLEHQSAVGVQRPGQPGAVLVTGKVHPHLLAQGGTYRLHQQARVLTVIEAAEDLEQL